MVAALTALGAGDQAEAEVRRHERAAKRGREEASPPAQQREQQQEEQPSKRGRVERRHTPVSAGRVLEQGGLPAQQIPQSRHGGGPLLQQPAAVLGAAAMPLQAGQGNQAWYQELQQRAAQHQMQQQSQGLTPQQVITTGFLWWTTRCCLSQFVKCDAVPCCSVVSLMLGPAFYRYQASSQRLGPLLRQSFCRFSRFWAALQLLKISRP